MSIFKIFKDKQFQSTFAAGLMVAIVGAFVVPAAVGFIGRFIPKAA